MSTRAWAVLAAAWGVVFAAPHVVWAAGPRAGLDTSLSRQAIRHGAAQLPADCAGIAVFCLCGAAVALDAGFLRRLPRWASIGLVWFGAVLLAARSIDIYVEFSCVLTGLEAIPADQHAEFLHLSRWFLFCWLPWFTAGAVAWTGLAVRVTRAGRGSRAELSYPPRTVEA